jgi:hypothetical protein
MPRRQYGSDEDINLLRMALMEQNANALPGRVPSGIAQNAYLGSIPRTFEQDREADILGEMDRRFAQTREDERARQSKVEDLKAGATMRDFETRTGVRDADIPLRKPKPFTAENFGPVPSHGPASEPAPEPEPPMRTIRRFTSEGTKPIDPDAAMGARERARLDPRVLASENQLAGDLALAGAKGKGEPGQSPYAKERNTRILQSVDELIDRVNLWTAGPGSTLSVVPGTDARDFAAELDTLKGNIGFGELTAMREASKTGGALGQVSNIELGMLTSALGGLDAGQSPANLKRQLAKVRGSIERWNAAQALYGVSGDRRPPGGAGGEQEFDFIPGRGLVPRGGQR